MLNALFATATGVNVVLVMAGSVTGANAKLVESKLQYNNML